VLNQSYSNFELIIVNDGSTDSGLLVVEKIQDERIKIINQENRGVSIARNFGVKHAQYELLAFLDADDWWDPDFLKEIFELIQKFSDAAVYSSSYFKVKNGKNIPAKIGVENKFKAGYINYYKVYSNTFWVPVNCSFVIVKKSIFTEVGGFNPKLKFGEDLDLWLRLSLQNKFAFVNKCLAYSNQDVDINNRALGSKKNWKLEEHFLFCLNKFEKEDNQDLKYLLDGIKLRACRNFYINQQHLNEVKIILKSVDLNLYDKKLTFYFRFPRFIVIPFLKMKALGSQIKKMLKK
jgi:glycosyltransferase involved in cell wall biosynthesis